MNLGTGSEYRGNHGVRPVCRGIIGWDKCTGEFWGRTSVPGNRGVGPVCRGDRGVGPVCRGNRGIGPVCQGIVGRGPRRSQRG